MGAEAEGIGTSRFARSEKPREKTSNALFLLFALLRIEFVFFVMAIYGLELEKLKISAARRYSPFLWYTPVLALAVLLTALTWNLRQPARSTYVSNPEFDCDIAMPSWASPNFIDMDYGYQDTYSWDLRYSLDITMPMLRNLTFRDAKAIDVFWDVVLGRGLQVFSALSLYDLLRMTTSELKEADARRSQPTGTHSFFPIYTTCRRLTTGVLLVLTIFTVILPTWLSVMTGYNTKYAAVFYEEDGTFFPSTDLYNCSFTIHDGSRIGLVDESCIGGTSDLTGPVMQYLGEVGKLPSATSTTGVREGHCFEPWANESSTFVYFDASIHLDPPTLNISTQKGNSSLYSHGVTPLPGKNTSTLLATYRCQPSPWYKWGFSYILVRAFNYATLFTSSLLLFVCYRSASTGDGIASDNGKSGQQVMHSNHCGRMDEPPLLHGNTRIRWKCVCGRIFYDDFVELRPGAADALELRLAGMLQHSTVNDLEAPSRSLTLASVHTNSCRSSTASNSVGNSWEFASRNGFVRSYKEISRPAIQPYQGVRYLLTCLHGSGNAPRLHQIPLHMANIHSDKDLSMALRRHYASANRGWMRLLRLRGLKSIEFVQFCCHENGFAEIRKCPDVPPETYVPEVYEFDQSDLLPPVGSNYLIHLFLHPDEYDTETIAYHAIPKKTARFEGGIGWGVQMVEGWVRTRLWMFVFFMLLLFAFAFALTWTCTGHGVQGAFAVASFVISVVGVLFGALQSHLG